MSEEPSRNGRGSEIPRPDAAKEGPSKQSAPPSDPPARAPSILLAEEGPDSALRLSTIPPSSKSAREFRKLIDRFHEGVLLTTRKRNLYANRALVRLLGYFTTEQLLGESPARLFTTHVPKPRRAELLEFFRAALASDDESLDTELTLRVRGDEEITAQLYLARVIFEDTPCLMVTLRDLTDERAMQEKLSRAERMASIGTLAAGVAHEINNPLAYVTTNIAYCVERLRYIEELLEGRSVRLGNPESLRTLLGPMSQALSEAHQGTSRVATIVRDLRALTRDDADQEFDVDLPSSIETAIHMVEPEFRFVATLVREFSLVGAVRGNETRLVQVFLNLILNAAQAFPTSDPERNRIVIRARAEGERTICEVEDNGVGISPQNLEKIFLPFFTTKAVGVGTGLGLSICHGLVSAMGGALSVASTVGRGTTFTVTLRSSEGPSPRSARRLPSSNPAGRARILVVDDEPLILRSVTRLLRDQHDVDVAANGREAYEKLRDEGPYDLVVCDLMMPIMTGMELYEEVRRTEPSTAERFVFLTGGAFTDAARRFLATIENPTLDKPVQPNLLRSVVSGVLSTYGPALPS